MNKFQIIILVLCAFAVINLSSKANVTQDIQNNARISKAIYRNQMFLKPQWKDQENNCYCSDSSSFSTYTTCVAGKANCTSGNLCNC
jgi:ribosomal protein S6